MANEKKKVTLSLPVETIKKLDEIWFDNNLWKEEKIKLLKENNIEIIPHLTTVK